MNNPPDSPAIAMVGITKRFGDVVANDNVYFDARTGEVHALIGENGAGKSTLMNILAGLYRPDEGTIAVNGHPVSFKSPRDSISQGIGMVYQHFMLVEPFTVAENVMLGIESGQTRLETASVERELERLSTRFALEVDPKARIWQLSVGEQQRVEILRLLYKGAKMLVFDEPTAVLTPQESDRLIATLRDMASNGFSIIFISHKLDEVLAVADRITVLRRGRAIATLNAPESDRHALAQLMVGRDLADRVEHSTDEPHTTAEPGNVVLHVHSLCADGDRGIPALTSIDLSVRSGEILGIAGVAGNGQRELAEVITGLRRATEGNVRVGECDITNRAPGEIASAGVAHIPEDRLATGLAPAMDVASNAIMRDYARPPIARGAFMIPQAIAAFADRLIGDYDIKTANRRAKVRTLSGGNQQKLLIARELRGEPNVVVAVHPTRGVDVGATVTIHSLLDEQRQRGAAVLLISEDLDELLALADRIAVMSAGRIMGTVDAAGANTDQIGLMMAGVAAMSPQVESPLTDA